MSEMQPPPRRPKGHRPQVFDDPAIDQLHAAFVALATELSVAFERIDTLERLLEQRAGVSRDDIERFQPDERAAADRAARRADVAERLLRPFRDFREDQIARALHSEQRSAVAPPRAP
jgi:hypothetical protein